MSENDVDFSFDLAGERTGQIRVKLFCKIFVKKYCIGNFFRYV
jgi:hypothetical protein